MKNMEFEIIYNIDNKNWELRDEESVIMTSPYRPELLHEMVYYLFSGNIKVKCASM